MTGIFNDAKEAVQRAQGLLEAAAIDGGADASGTPNDAVVAKALHRVSCSVARNAIHLHQLTVGGEAFREVPKIEPPTQLMLKLSP